MTRAHLVPLLHAERAALADALQELPDDAWAHPSLCAGWTVHDVLAHLTAAARTPTLPWLTNMTASRFDTDRHNQRLLQRHQATDPASTLAAFQASLSSTSAPFGAREGMLGEVVVHSQDIARPLGLPLVPTREAAQVVAAFFARKDFAINSSTLVRGLRLEAADDEFTAGDGPVLRGTLLALVMAMAGRDIALDELDGDGVGILRDRLFRR